MTIPYSYLPVVVDQALPVDEQRWLDLIGVLQGPDVHIYKNRVGPSHVTVTRKRWAEIVEFYDEASFAAAMIALIVRGQALTPHTLEYNVEIQRGRI